MKPLKIFFLLLLGFILVIIDVAFLSNLEFFGVTILTSYIALLEFAILNRKSNSFLAFSVILFALFAIFSSLPLPILVLNFILLPAFLIFIKSNYFAGTTILSTIFFLLFASFLFESILVLYAGFSLSTVEIYLSMIVFTLLHTIIGFAVYLVARVFKKNFLSIGIEEEIR